MSATDAQKAELRRMCALADADTTYTAALLGTYIEAHPVLDARGERPTYWDTSTSPPTETANPLWVPTYDLHAAAARIWQEKAAAVADKFDVAADGTTLTRSQVVAGYMKQARYHNSRRTPSSMTMIKSPKEPADSEVLWIGNLPEPRD